MKAKALPTFLYLIIVLLLTSFSDPYAIKRISDTNYRYEFYTTLKKPNPKSDKMYYWFKGGLIHNAQGGIAGELIDGKFVKMYHSNQLAEQGFFKKGLKIGLWKTWYPNGIIETKQQWNNGLKSGKFYHYNEKGIVIEKGNFRSNEKQGQWIDYSKKDTIFYKRGNIFVKEVEPSIDDEPSINLEEIERKEIPSKNKKNKKDKTIEKSPEKEPKKDGLFKKIFKKKQLNQN